MHENDTPVEGLITVSTTFHSITETFLSEIVNGVNYIFRKPIQDR